MHRGISKPELGISRVLAKCFMRQACNERHTHNGSQQIYVNEHSQELAKYWQHDFDWRQSEARINSFHNYKLLVNGIDVHFIHEQSPDPNALPLIFTHGWPGSFLESLKLIKLLTQPSEVPHCHDSYASSLYALLSRPQMGLVGHILFVFCAICSPSTWMETVNLSAILARC